MKHTHCIGLVTIMRKCWRDGGAVGETTYCMYVELPTLRADDVIHIFVKNVVGRTTYTKFWN